MTIFFDMPSGDFIATDATNAQTHDIWHRYQKSGSDSQGFAGFLRNSGYGATKCEYPLLMVPCITISVN